MKWNTFSFTDWPFSVKYLFEMFAHVSTGLSAFFLSVRYSLYFDYEFLLEYGPAYSCREALSSPFLSVSSLMSPSTILSIAQPFPEIGLLSWTCPARHNLISVLCTSSYFWQECSFPGIHIAPLLYLLQVFCFQGHLSKASPVFPIGVLLGV